MKKRHYRLKQALQFEHLQQNLAFIQTYFHMLPETMKELETPSLPLTHSMDLVNAIIENIENIPGDYGQKVNRKLHAVFQRNSNFKILSKVSDILKGANVEGPQEISPKYWCKYKYAPTTSCDVERSFLAYKLILTDKRYNFPTCNLEKTIVLYCNLNYNN